MRVNAILGGRLAAAAAVLLLAVTFVLYPSLPTHLFSRADCLLCDPRLLWMHVISDATIGAAYAAIAGTLIYLMLANRREIPFPQIFIAFGILLVAAAVTRVMDIVLIWRPLYWLAGNIELLTALASLVSALLLPFFSPHVKRTLNRAAEAAENHRRFLIQPRQLVPSRERSRPPRRHHRLPLPLCKRERRPDDGQKPRAGRRSVGM
jgi:hypothetical protein